MGTRDFKFVFALDEPGKANLDSRRTSLHYDNLLFVPPKVPVIELPTRVLEKSDNPWYYPIGIADGSLILGWTELGKTRFLKGISVEAVRGIRNGKGMLLLLNHLEGDVMNDEVIECIHKGMDEYGIPREKVVLVTANMLAENHYESWNRRNPGSKRIHVVSYDAFQEIAHRITTGGITQHPPIPHEKWLETRNKHRGKRYLLLNRRPHAHRVLAVTELHRENLLAHGHVSMPADVRREKNRPRNYSAFTWTLNGEVCHERHMDCYVDIPDDLQRRLPLTVDVDGFEKNHAKTWTQWPFLDSYLNVVTETRIDDTLFVTEKVFKPIVNMQPFVVLGSRNTLRYLHQEGYRTFDLDESYDEERDPAMRMYKAIAEVKKIARLPTSQVHDWYWSQQEVLEHNRQVLWDKSNITMLLLARLWKILHS